MILLTKEGLINSIAKLGNISLKDAEELFVAVILETLGNGESIIWHDLVIQKIDDKGVMFSSKEQG